VLPLSNKAEQGMGLQRIDGWLLSLPGIAIT
jgi:hypothetical protein